MGLNFKTILFLLCFLDSLILGYSAEISEILPGGEATLEGNLDNLDTTFTVAKQNSQGTSFSTYFDITLTSEGKTYPNMYVTKDPFCQERLFVGIQNTNQIIGFITNDQLNDNDKFYICIIFPNNVEKSSYNIKVKNENSVSIPFNSQLSYYVTSNTKEVTFSFDSDKSYSETNTVATFWVKGENIDDKITMNNNFLKKKFDHGYVFSGSISGVKPTLMVPSNDGDYITVGCTIVEGGNTSQDLKENQNEIIISSASNKVCVGLSFQGISFITGKIYTRKASVSFKTEKDKIINELGGEQIQKDIDDGIIAYFNPFPWQENEEDKKGFICLENDKDMIFSIQLSSYYKDGVNDASQIIYTPLYPGEIQRHFLPKDKIGIFYGVKPTTGFKEVNLNFKIIKGFPEMYYDRCKKFPGCTYSYEDQGKGSESLENLEHPVPSNMITVYSFYKDDDPSYGDYNPYSQFQPLMIVYCGDGGKEGTLEAFYCEFDTTIFTDKDSIKLYKDTTFSQYLLKGEFDT